MIEKQDQLVGDLVNGERPSLLSDDEEIEAEEINDGRREYEVEVYCADCGTVLCCVILTDQEGLRVFQQLLVERLDFVCPDCSDYGN
ncbi:putative transforming protein E7 [Four-toed hedgehog papillomavirus]|nr:putative transforming protein E7 [Four-toed hedgehog papillomavirus]